ncbi:uncharacterized protein V6R79_000311 [Siganus canaliculatus]
MVFAFSSTAMENPTTPESNLQDLQCHFTWDLDPSRSILLCIREELEDIGTEEGNSWLAHIYNLQGYIHYKLDSTEEAQRFFNKAAETFKKTRPDKTEEGPWLVVNCGNQAWLHHHLGNQAESQMYLSKVQDLMEKYPPPPQEELHPEVYAEKAWTLMNFRTQKELTADCFQRAIRMEPDRVEWNTSYVIGLVRDFNHSSTGVEADIMEKMKTAIEKDPENLYLAAQYLQHRATKGERIADEARELACKVLRNPVSSYSGIKPLLRVYRHYVSVDEGIKVAEEALGKHPDSRYLKRCAALCYKWKIAFSNYSKQAWFWVAVFARAVSLHKEVISLYPHTSFVKKVDLASIYAKSNHSKAKAEQTYEELLKMDLTPAEKQMLYNSYAKHLYYNQSDRRGSVQYHMKAAEIPFRKMSIVNTYSSTQNPKAFQSKLKALQCHFTWELDPSRSKLIRLRDKLDDIGTEEGNSWLAHIYNLQGYIHYKLGSTEEAQRFFNKAAETFKKTRPDKTEEGPWLVVNCGNQAWLHHHLGNQAESQKYLSKVQDLMEKYPPPPQEELHPEVCAEKAWTLMNFGTQKELTADCFQRAIRMEPDRVEWNTSYVIGVVRGFKHSSTGVDADIMEKMKTAMEKDPENLYLAAQYLQHRAKKGERIADEARELARKVLRNPVSSYSGIKPILRVYRHDVSVDEGIKVAEEALEKHPDSRYLKRCAALCYKWKIVFNNDRFPKQTMIDRAVSLHKEVISLYPLTSFVKKLDLASIYAKSRYDQAKAELIYQELLKMDLTPAEKQMLYNSYANHLYYNQSDSRGSVQYHMKAAEIPHQSFFRDNSIRVLEKIRDKGRDRMCREIRDFLENLEEPSEL